MIGMNKKNLNLQFVRTTAGMFPHIASGINVKCINQCSGTLFMYNWKCTLNAYDVMLYISHYKNYLFENTVHCSGYTIRIQCSSIDWCRDYILL